MAWAARTRDHTTSGPPFFIKFDGKKNVSCVSVCLTFILNFFHPSSSHSAWRPWPLSPSPSLCTSHISPSHCQINNLFFRSAALPKGLTSYDAIRAEGGREGGRRRSRDPDDATRRGGREGSMQIEISRGRDPQIEPSYCSDGQTDAVVVSIREKFVEMEKSRSLTTLPT